MNKTIKNLIFILILGSISAALLLSIRNYTIPVIEKYRIKQLKESILTSAGISHENKDVEQLFDKFIRTKNLNGFNYFRSPTGLYIFGFRGRGLWGLIDGIITLKPDMETIKLVKIIWQEETPGLGARIVEPDFEGAFRDKKVEPPLSLAIRGKAVMPNEIDAITGATISSRAVVDIINRSVKEFQEKLGK